jgi:hypothetical protein
MLRRLTATVALGVTLLVIIWMVREPGEGESATSGPGVSAWAEGAGGGMGGDLAGSGEVRRPAPAGDSRVEAVAPAVITPAAADPVTVLDPEALEVLVSCEESPDRPSCFRERLASSKARVEALGRVLVLDDRSRATAGQEQREELGARREEMERDLELERRVQDLLRARIAQTSG